MSDIKRNPAHYSDPLTDVVVPLDPYHGDLRKGAYLKRRAAYQMQASAPSATSRCGCNPPRRLE